MNADHPAHAVARRSTHLLPGGLYRFEDTLAVGTTISATILTCGAWLLEIYELESGQVIFATGVREVRSRGRRFAAIFPPFSIARLRVDCVRGRVLGYADTTALPPSFSAVPMVLQVAAEACAARPSDILRAARPVQAIPAWPRASALSRRAKNIIDRSCRAPVSIAHVATELGVTAAHLSRQFKRDFHMTPSAYLHQLRLADAPLLLARGEAIGTISHEVGYRDLSRFYKQFRKATRTSPGTCREMIAPRPTTQLLVAK